MPMAAPTYRFPDATGAPSLGLMKRHNVVVVDVVCAPGGGLDGDINIVHNLGVPVAAGTDGMPEINWAHIAAPGSGAFLIGPYFTFIDVNTIHIWAHNAGQANDGWTVRLWIRRPHSLNR